MENVFSFLIVAGSKYIHKIERKRRYQNLCLVSRMSYVRFSFVQPRMNKDRKLYTATYLLNNLFVS